MAGTNAQPAKKALFELLTAELGGIRVDYAYDGKRAEREYVYLGRVVGTQRLETFKGGLGNRPTRDEDLLLNLHIRVTGPGQQVADTDARATEIGTVIEELLAGEQLQTPGLLYAGIAELELDPGNSDEAATSTLLYRVALESTLD
jgi:hypothetical protein